MQNIFKVFFVFLICINNITAEAKIEIKYKVGEEIITNMDIINEKNYLIFLRPRLGELSNEEILKISEKSLVREIIKKKEINKVFKNLDNEILTNEVKKKLFIFKKVKNEEEFLKLLNTTNLEYKKIVEKMKYEAFWNELVFQKYNSLIKVDKKNLKLILKNKISNNKKYEYNISELLFDLDKNEKFESKHKEIIEYINNSDFKTAASRFSISNSAKNGGEIGWIKETILSDNLVYLLNRMKKNEISKPIKYPTGYLILYMNDKREIKQLINFEEELEELINYERNKQLNQFSLLLYKKLKQNTIINEY